MQEKDNMKQDDMNEEQDERQEAEEKEKDNSSRVILLSLLAITILVISVISVSFATFLRVQEGMKSNTISTGNISMNYTEDTNGISITDALPTSDAIGKTLKGKGEYFDFTINSTIVGDVSVSYEIAAIKDEKSSIPDNAVKLYLEQQKSGSYEQVMAPTFFTPIDKQTNVGAPKGSMVLMNVTKKESAVDNYRLRMWLDENAVVEAGKYYSVKINVYGKAL